MKHSTKRTKRSGKGKAFKIITRWCHQYKDGKGNFHLIGSFRTPIAKSDTNERNMFTQKVKIATVKV